jgi:hypothetical protein
MNQIDIKKFVPRLKRLSEQDQWEELLRQVEGRDDIMESLEAE